MRNSSKYNNSTPGWNLSGERFHNFIFGTFSSRALNRRWHEKWKLQPLILFLNPWQSFRVQCQKGRFKVKDDLVLTSVLVQQPVSRKNKIFSLRTRVKWGISDWAKRAKFHVRESSRWRSNGSELKEVGRSFRENAKITSSCLRQTESFRLQPGWKHWKPPTLSPFNIQLFGFQTFFYKIYCWLLSESLSFICHKLPIYVSLSQKAFEIGLKCSSPKNPSSISVSSLCNGWHNANTSIGSIRSCLHCSVELCSHPMSAQYFFCIAQ